jgi:hypothetical protein
MDREMEVLHLAEADAHIERAEDIISRQFDIIDELERKGRDLTTASIQLHGFEGVLETMRHHRRIIVQRISDIDGEPVKKT